MILKVEVNQLIQDKGVGPEDEQFDKIKSKVFKAPDKRKYKDLWKLSKTFVDKMKLNKERFQRYPSNSDDAAVIRKINGIIFSLRDNREGVFFSPSKFCAHQISFNVG